MLRLLPSLALAAALTGVIGALGCGGGGSTDGGPGPDATSCPVNMHSCSGSCVADGDNDPATGCRLGCGSACPSPTGGVPICSAGACDVMCTAPYERSGGTCVCMPQSCSARGIQCGMTDDGCGTSVNCGMCGTGQACVDGACACGPDGAEPNEDPTTAFALGDFPTMPDTVMSFAMFSLQSMDDVDFFKVRVVDAELTMNPVMRVTLSNVPAGSDFELGVWFTCDNSPNTSRCDQGTPDTSFGDVGCIGQMSMTGGLDRAQITGFCNGEEKSGDLIIRVRATTWMNACMPYTLEVSIA